MKKKNNNEEITNWVVGKEFSKIKLMDILSEVDDLETIAEFGYRNYEESLENSDLDIYEVSYHKIEAFKLLVAKLDKIIDNTSFAIINNKKDMESYKEKLYTIKKVIPKLYYKIGTNKVNLKKFYNNFLEILKEIKSKINIPLYKNNLIYITKENYDPVEAKKKVIDKLANI